MKNTLKEKLQNHQQPIGTFFELGSANVAEALGKTGLDFIIIDNEHGPFEAESTLDYVRGALLGGVSPLARVREISRPAVDVYKRQMPTRRGLMSKTALMTKPRFSKFV